MPAVRRPYGNHTMSFDIVCKDNPTATVRLPYDRRAATVKISTLRWNVETIKKLPT